MEELEEKRAYLPFIDGMRAIAIIAVVAYHVEGSALPGGFVGVDVFFVISGFLIIGQIQEALRAGRFSFGDFWARRVVRILPPYLLTILLSFALAHFVLVLPSETASFGEQVLYSSVMAGNHLFLDQSGYFDAAAHTKPLLNLWSLAVEEQFYVICPIACSVLAAVFRRNRVWFRVLVAVTFITSFVACVAFTGSSVDDKNHAFFLTPMRIWEFMLGWAALVLAPLLARVRIVSGVACVVGLGMIVGSAVFMHDSMPFPSYWAAVPCIGTALVLVGGLVSPDGICPVLLSQPPMRFVGRVSYAWYLLHWPALVLTSLYWFAPSPVRNVTCAAITFVLAVAMHYGLERPLQRSRQRSREAREWRTVAFGVSACLLFGIGGILATRSRNQQDTVVRVETDTPPLPEACDLTSRNTSIAKCIGKTTNRSTVFILGDSHAGMYAPVVNRHANDHGLKVLSAPLDGCAPFLDVVKHSRTGHSPKSCSKQQEKARKFLGKDTFSRAIVAAAWPWHEAGLDAPNGTLSHAEEDDVFIRELVETLDLLAAAGVERVLILGSVPLWDRNKKAPECIAHADARGENRDKACSLPRQQAMDQARRSHSLIRKAIANRQGIRFVEPMRLFCDDTWCRAFNRDGVLYRDHSHLNDAGAAVVYEAFESDFQWLFGPLK